nr:MAG TPA: hypothetical protein [Caudoviricetes sp.]
MHAQVEFPKVWELHVHVYLSKLQYPSSPQL